MFKIFLIASIIIIGAILIWVISPNWDRSQWKDDYTYFDSSNIHGTIEHLGVLHHTTGLKINNIPREFSVSTYVDIKLNGSTDFDYIAAIGDSILKKPFSDTLTLIHEKQIYRYRFEKYDPDTHY